MVRNEENTRLNDEDSFCLGYDSIYIKRSGDKFDGCCLFFKADRLRLITSKTVPFYQRNIQVLDRYIGTIDL